MSELPRWFHAFCSPGDRFAVLTRALGDALVPFDVVETGPFRHVQTRGGRAAVPVTGEKLFLAHYDRVAGTPGANDNGASVLALVDYLTRPRKTPPLRVIFTDGEELAGQGAAEQGSYALARTWGGVRGLLPLVLDMTGIGDTLVLGHLAEQLVRRVRGESSPVEPGESDKVRRAAKRFLSICGGIEIDTPFSDDLGLLLAGVPAVQLSLLPRKEAALYRRTGELPPSWRAMHTPDDTPDTLWPQSRALMADVLGRFEQFPW
jgi:Zn-dependent M28 family amino/carboxypeptidase